MGKLSLYAKRYEEIQARISNDTVLGQNAGVVNIAGNAQRITVECIPGGAFKDWRWRQVGDQCFAILPFYMKVYSTKRTPGIQLRHCKIQLSFSASGGNNATIDVAKEDLNEESLGHVEMIRLEEVPLPQYVKTNITSNGSKFWEFYSRIIHERYSSERAAVSWEWNNRHLLDDYPSAQHGAILISHPQAPFYLACQVSGSARKFPYQYRFSNEGIQPRWRPIIPQPPDRTVLHIRDIKGEFQDIMRAQISTELTTSHTQISPPSRTTELSQSQSPPLGMTSTASHQSQEYGPTNVTGNSRAHLGNLIEVQNNYFTASLPRG